MIQSIFTNPNFFNLSDPQSTWLFDVMLYSVKNNENNTYFTSWFKNNTIITSVSLPSYHTETVTLKYWGSEKTFPVLRTYGGDCTMKFDVRTENHDMMAIEKIAQIDSRYRISGTDYIRFHPELQNVEGHVTFEKVFVRLIDKTLPSENEKFIHAEYEYNNCIITEFGFNEELDYSSDSKLTGKITFHYDLWHKTKGIAGA